MIHRWVDQTSLYNEIAVYDTTELFGEHGRFRVLQFSSNAVQGAIDLNAPQRILFEYPRAIIALIDTNKPPSDDARLFVIGHGIGTIAGHYAGTRLNVNVSEIDPLVAELSKTYFGYKGDNVEIGDGRELLAAQPDRSCDFIVLDAFTSKGTPRHLQSDSFFQLAGSKLRSHGLIIVNMIASGLHDPIIEALGATMSSVFRHVQAFMLPADRAADRHNLLFAASGGPIRYETRLMAGFKPYALRGTGFIIADAKR